MSTIARFHDYDPSISGYRYIMLTDAAPTLETSTSSRDEEGYSSTYTTWTLDGDRVTCETTTRGRDCDGETSSYSLVTCDVSALASRDAVSYEDGETVLPFRVPTWDEGKRSQRDYAAEAAGY